MCYLCNGIALVCVLSALILAPFWIRVAILVFILGEQLLGRSHGPLGIVQQRHVDVAQPLDQSDAALQNLSAASSIAEPQFQYRGVSYTPSTKHTVER
jgi:hypothetical protein